MNLADLLRKQIIISVQTDNIESSVLHLRPHIESLRGFNHTLRITSRLLGEKMKLLVSLGG